MKPTLKLKSWHSLTVLIAVTFLLMAAPPFPPELSCHNNNPWTLRCVHYCVSEITLLFPASAKTRPTRAVKVLSILGCITLFFRARVRRQVSDVMTIDSFNYVMSDLGCRKRFLNSPHSFLVIILPSGSHALARELMLINW